MGGDTQVRGNEVNDTGERGRANKADAGQVWREKQAGEDNKTKEDSVLDKMTQFKDRDDLNLWY